MTETKTLLQDAPRSNPLTRTTYHPVAALLCQGDVPHYSPMPRVTAEGASGPVECSECGAPMDVVDIITVERSTSWSSVDWLSRQRRYFGV